MRYIASRFPRALAALLLALTLSSASACKPTVEGQSQAWQANLSAVSEYSARWPGMRAALNASKAEAEQLMKASDGVSDQEARAQAMKAANKILAPLVERLHSLDSEAEALDNAARRLDRLSLDEAQAAEVEALASEAKRARAEVDEVMKTAKPENAASARRLLDEQISRLAGVKSACEEAFERLSQPAEGKSPPTPPQG